MNNPPLKMLLQEPYKPAEEVWVYDFMHDINESFQSLALCWSPKSNTWTTIPVSFLNPITNEKKKLTEEVITT